MASPDSQDKHRSSQIDDLIAKQDHVIKELDDLDKRLLATIEELKAAKKKAPLSRLFLPPSWDLLTGPNSTASFK